jgi:hypothetical protein
VRAAEAAEKPKSGPLNFVEESDQTYGTDHYKPREVEPASKVPTEQDERAKWLAEQPSDEFLVDGRPVHDATDVGERIRRSLDVEREDEQRRPAAGPYDMDEMRRLAGLDKPKSNDQDKDTT